MTALLGVVFWVVVIPFAIAFLLGFMNSGVETTAQPSPKDTQTAK